jgi:hypothetical protein
VQNASVGAGASGGQSWKGQSGRYKKPAGCSTSVACRGRPCKQTKKQASEILQTLMVSFKLLNGVVWLMVSDIFKDFEDVSRVKLFNKMIDQ